MNPEAMVHYFKRWFAAILGAAIGWCLHWLVADCLGITSPIHHAEGTRFYLVGTGALLGYSTVRWGWWRTSQLYDDWCDTFGPDPVEPQSLGPYGERVTPERKPDTEEESL